MGDIMIYLDYSATTPIDSEILDLYVRIEKDFFANTTSLHRLGQRSNYMFEKCKQELLDCLGLKNNEMIFTSNATEANNLAILGYLSKYKSGKVISTKVEHPSVYEVYKHLEKIGFEVVYLDVLEDGTIDLEQFKKVIDKDTLLVSVMWVNNIVGSIEPISEIIEILKNYKKTKLHVDMVQGLCKISPLFSLNDVDMFTFSTHKIYGPKGVGALVYKKNIELEKRLYGSSSQNGLKPGTLDLALAVCTCKAIKKYYPLTLKHYEYVKELNKRLIEGLKNIPYVHINSNEKCSPYIVSISIIGINGETLVHSLEEKEIYVSTGSSCASKLAKPEKTILAMSNSIELAKSSIRISLSHLVKYEEIDELLCALGEVRNV